MSFAPARWATIEPTCVEPVKNMNSNFSASNAVMTSIPSPGTLGPTTETTAGSRYRENRSSRSVDEKGTSLLGFRMTLLPAATAPATMEIVNKKG